MASPTSSRTMRLLKPSNEPGVLPDSRALIAKIGNALEYLRVIDKAVICDELREQPYGADVPVQAAVRRHTGNGVARAVDIAGAKYAMAGADLEVAVGVGKEQGSGDRISRLVGGQAKPFEGLDVKLVGVDGDSLLNQEAPGEGAVAAVSAESGRVVQRRLEIALLVADHAPISSAIDDKLPPKVDQA